MNDIISKYFSKELTEKEKCDFLISIDQNSDLKEEFTETQNLLGILGLLPHKDDMSTTKVKLSIFLEYIQKHKES